MGKYIILLFSFTAVISCSAQKNSSKEIVCPKSFISMEHKNYYSMNQELENVLDYTATINNLKSKCNSKNNQSTSSVLDILFVLKPINSSTKSYHYNYFVAVLDNNKVLDYQLFQINGNFNIDENNLPIETTIIDSLDQHFPSLDNSYEILIGFALTKEKYEFMEN